MIVRVAVLLGLALVASADQLRINCGGLFIANIGWREDTLKYAAKPINKYSPQVGGVTAPGSWRPVYDSHAWAPTTLKYDVPVVAGDYKVSMLFAETFNEEAGKRVMDIKLNGKVSRAGLDVFVAAGGKNKGFFLFGGMATVGADEILSIEITASAGNPMISGFVIDGADAQSLVGSEGLVDGPPPPSPSPVVQPPAGPKCKIGVKPNLFQMNVGGPAVADLDYAAENEDYISSPNSIKATNTMATPPGAIFRTERYTTAMALTIKIPVPAGKYTVVSQHAETFFTAAGERTFDVLANGEERRTEVDVFQSAGGANRALEVLLTGVPSVDGFITITFKKRKENPMVNAIRVVGTGAGKNAVGGGCGSVKPPPPPPGSVKCREARDVTGSTADKGGFQLNVGGKALPNIGWAADNVNYITGANKGFLYRSPKPVKVTGTWGAVWPSSRYTFTDMLEYRIPAPTGKFTIALFFVESFFGKVGERTFDVAINGETLIADLDIFARVGMDTPLYLQFGGIETTPGGFLTISLKKKIENPTLNGIYIQGAGIGNTAIGGFENGQC